MSHLGITEQKTSGAVISSQHPFDNNDKVEQISSPYFNSSNISAIVIPRNISL